MCSKIARALDLLLQLDGQLQRLPRQGPIAHSGSYARLDHGEANHAPRESTSANYAEPARRRGGKRRIRAGWLLRYVMDSSGELGGRPAEEACACLEL